MVAVTKLASVPASMARRPRRARSCRRVGASAPMPPIWIPIELKFAKPQSANVAIVNDRGSSVAFSEPSSRVGDELVERHPRAEQVADGRRVPPRHAHAPGDRREHPAEDLLQAEADEAEQRVDERDQRQERDQHGADVQRERQALAGTAAGGIDDVDVGPLDLQLARSPSFPAARSRGRRSWPSSACPGAVMMTAVSRCCASMPKRM